MVIDDLLNIRTEARSIMHGMDGKADPETMGELLDIADAAVRAKAVLSYMADALDAISKGERAITKMETAAGEVLPRERSPFDA